MNANTKPKAAAIDKACDSPTGSVPRRTLRTRLIAYLLSNPAYLAAWTDGAIFGTCLCAIAFAVLEGK